MGLGIGISCEGCDVQLYYGDDDKEIMKYTEVDQRGSMRVIQRPVMCHRCSTLMERLFRLLKLSE